MKAVFQSLLKHVARTLLILPLAAAVPLPSRIEAEKWDRFSDTQSKPGTQECNDSGGGLNVGWIQPGEWLEYDVKVVRAGDFRISLRVSSTIDKAKRLRILIDGHEAGGPIVFTRAEGWQSWYEVGFAPIAIRAGDHKVRVIFETGDFNFNWLEFLPYVPVKPSSPEHLRVSDVRTDSATLTWSSAMDDEIGFNFYLSTSDTKPPTPTALIVRGDLSKTLAGLPPATKHYVWLEATNPSGTGAAASCRFITLSTMQPNPVALGAGSYAEFPPYDEGDTPGKFQDFALNAPLNVLDDEKRPIPTNDWWTHLLLNDSNTSLWSYPQVTRTTPDGFRFYCPHQFTADGSHIESGESVLISAEGFKPGRFVAEDWSDWSVVVRAGEGEKIVRATVAHGIPFTWFQFEKAQAILGFSTTAEFADAAGKPVKFPLTASCLRVSMDGSYFGLHFPEGTTISEIDGVLRPSCTFVVVSALPDADSLAAFQEVALNRPVKTETRWNLDGAGANLTATWNVTTETPDSKPGGNTLQGFLIHHRQSAKKTGFGFSNYIYPDTTRGALTLAEGKSFQFTYPWQGIVAHYPKPADLTGEVPWRPEVMERIISEYVTTASYGTDTYWGGKGLVMLGKYMLFAKETDHPAYPALKEKLRGALSDWLTYTPGEKSRYFAAYPRWGAVVGFDESYGSYQFTDQHFHYGYLIHAASLMAMDDPEWVRAYQGMLTMVAKEYANWDRSDSRFPFLRTFDPWMGHSYAGGIGSAGGNNQESTSESLQAWAGLFFLGDTLGDKLMRDVGAFGYHQESQATMEYWFNRSGGNWPSAYKAAHDIVGVLWNDGFAYGTFFSAAPQHIYGIQWLPVMPSFKHLVQGVDRQWTDNLYNGLHERLLAYYQKNGDSIAEDGKVTLQEIGQDWGNALLGYRLFSAPVEVAATLEDFRISTDPAESGTLFSPEGGLNYYYCHGHLTFGEIAWDRRLSLPASTVFKNPATGAYTYVVFNPSDKDVICEVISENGSVVGRFSAPPGKTIAHKLDAKLSRIVVSAPKKHLVVGENMTIEVTGFDQYGAGFALTDARISVSGGGTMDINGRFNAKTRADRVTVTAAQDGLSGTFSFRIGDPLRISSLNITPLSTRVEIGKSQTFACSAKDQYGNAFPLDLIAWTAKPGRISADGVYVAPDSPVTARISAAAGGRSATVSVIVSPAALNLALNKSVKSSGVAAGNEDSQAVDGSKTSRWESTQGMDQQFLQVDLGGSCDLKSILIDWESASAKSYTIDISLDGENWTIAHSRKDAPSEARRQDEIDLRGTSARHVRLSALSRNTQYGYSIWEFQILGYTQQGK